MKQEKAKELIIAEWYLWAPQQKNPTELNGFVFYNYLAVNKSELLNFQCRGDKWQKVHGWLLNAGLVSN